jgi:hypothetical protein
MRKIEFGCIMKRTLASQSKEFISYKYLIKSLVLGEMLVELEFFCIGLSTY